MSKRKSAPETVDAKTALEHFQDYLAPKLDVYEQAVYLYILRHSRLVGRPTVSVELKSARHKIARGLGKKGGPIAVRTCLEKLRSLDAKGCIKLVEECEDAPGVQVLVPSEMPGVIGRGGPAETARPRGDGLLQRGPRTAVSSWSAKTAGASTVSRRSTIRVPCSTTSPAGQSGDETYRNVVASCRRCNNRKGESGGEDLLRVLFREGFITSGLLADRLAAIEKLRAGELRPPVV